MTQAKYGPIDQIGYLVDDLDASIARWIDLMGVGPWTVFRNVSLNGSYRGQAGTVTMDVGLAYQGDVQIELIKITNETPSPYRDAAGQPILGVHHVAWVVDDLEAVVARAKADGLKVAFEATNPGTRVVYMEADGEPGVLFEFIESPATRDMINSGIVATRNWDGSNPVHVIDFAA
ncbi:Catechol 2,3-dioxygenase [Sphingomonas laterariae]|uniref:Catechol 2,3-dioxygenase n=1 Tax=Edaphosphingomonas laterariae TaxID=861865 RepID=A0A239FWJ9_9SPHN|nr:VOC family protein [Sphingomonas laterariae]SNS61115.1 Catechol 2,3-dioxygenase [Sphingomonas laterariae]